MSASRSTPKRTGSDSSSDRQPPRRELDQEKTGQRAGTPCNLIRRPIEEAPMRRVQR